LTTLPVPVVIRAPRGASTGNGTGDPEWWPGMAGLRAPLKASLSIQSDEKRRILEGSGGKERVRDDLLMTE
jgi:hypothetical protein